MEFRFNLNEIFQHPIVEIGNSLIPPGFSGDKRALWDTQSKITQIVNAMGEASAQAQGLSKPITTADRLRNSEHRLYLLVDPTANNGKGAVTGMLKTGEKGLYVFDREGQHYQVSPPCVLDFYIHESRQRSGFGKRLFEHMLQKEQIEPVKMAIDRPSDKFLGFLNKHYGLNTPVKQMNNYVVFDGFFPRSAETARTVEADKSYTPTKKQSANGLQAGYASSPYGRYGAPRPTCSMGQIIHNDSPVIKRNQEPAGVRSEPVTNVQGQANSYYGNQQAWQTTQSTPNMHFPYSQNQQMYNQNQTPYVPNQNYFQHQPPASTYPASTGEFQGVGQTMQYNMQNYAMAQGDASGHMYEQDMNSPTMLPCAQGGQNQMQSAPLRPNQMQDMPQDLNYSYNQQNLYPNQAYAQVPQYYKQETVSIPVKAKEPLVPQHLDGTLRKTPHAVQSMPVQGENQPSAVILQNSASAPVNYQHQAPNMAQNYNSVNQRPDSAAASLQNTMNQQQMPMQSALTPANYHQQPLMNNLQQKQVVSNLPPQQIPVPQIVNQNKSPNQTVAAVHEPNIVMPQLANTQPGLPMNVQPDNTQTVHQNQPNNEQNISTGSQLNITRPNEQVVNKDPYATEQHQNPQQVQMVSQVAPVSHQSAANIQYSAENQMQKNLHQGPSATHQHMTSLQQNVNVSQLMTGSNQPQTDRFTEKVATESPNVNAGIAVEQESRAQIVSQ